MTEVYENLFVGAGTELDETNPTDWAFVHCTNLLIPPDAKKGADYTFYKRKNDFYLNWIDGTIADFEKVGTEAFSEAMDFIDEQLPKKKVFVHCDFGTSRGPTMAMVYLAKRTHTITNDSYDAAREEFAKIYPGYFPNEIRVFARVHWEELR